MNRKTLGIVLMWIGFLSASYFVMEQLDTVNWLAWALTGGLGVIGVVLIRSSDMGEATHVEKLDTDMNTLESSLARLVSKLDEMIKAKDSTFVYDVHGKIDAELSADLAGFADARESIIHAIGMHEYAMIMDNFARGERTINRAWSASADGYIDEVWVCMEKGQGFLKEADQLLRSYMNKKD